MNKLLIAIQIQLDNIYVTVYSLYIIIQSEKYIVNEKPGRFIMQSRTHNGTLNKEGA